MAKMIFAKTVTYQGERHIANSAFVVEEAEVEALKQAGGWVIEEPKVEAEPEAVVETEPVEAEAEEDEDPIAAAVEASKPKKAKRKAE